MFTHMVVGSNNPDRARKFYDATMEALGGQPSQSPEGSERHFYGEFGKGMMIVGKPRDGEPATHANGGTIGLQASSKEQVDSWHAAGLANGGTCEGEPGPRPQVGNIYAAYLRDPDGNKLCAICPGG